MDISMIGAALYANHKNGNQESQQEHIQMQNQLNMYNQFGQQSLASLQQQMKPVVRVRKCEYCHTARQVKPGQHDCEGCGGPFK